MPKMFRKMFSLGDTFGDDHQLYTITSAKPGKWDWTLGYSQYSWLKAILEGSNARYLFVFAHHTRGEGRGAAKTGWDGINLFINCLWIIM
jgi:hypothetical protein